MRVGDQRVAITLFVLVPALLGPKSVQGGDWPMWRHDAGHTASSPHALPEQLHLQWTRQYTPRSPVWDDPLNRDMMPYDRIFEPVVADGRMYLAFNDADKVVALDVEDGSELWTFRTDGPVRFSPVVSQDSVLFCSDDGYLYCVDGADGALRWRFRGGPSDRKIIGNGRIVSTWPARGGPVVAEDTVYFAAGIWPFMGVFIHALDVDTGAVQWIHDDTSAEFQKQPHSAPSFAGVAPQGQLTVAGDLLLVPGGRSLPAALDRHTGELVFFNFGGKGQGGSFLAADDGQAFVHTRVRETLSLDLPSGSVSEFRIHEPVLAEGRLYAARAAIGEEGNAPLRVEAYDRQNKRLWQAEVDGTGDLIQAGSRLYAAGGSSISAIELHDNAPPKVVWSTPVDGVVLRLLAAADRLFAVTEDGRILAFGEEATRPAVLATPQKPLRTDSRAKGAVRRVQKFTTQHAGYMLWYGVDDPSLVDAFVAHPEFRVVVVDPNVEKVSRLRKHYDDAGLYGHRVVVHEGTPDTFRAPPYIANLIVVGRSVANQMADLQRIRAIYESVRPYGGTLRVACDTTFRQTLLATIERADLPKASWKPSDDAVSITRVGALDGAGDWTHAYGDVANTVKSNDRRVKLPLGILWFGGISNLDILPRHGHGPSQQVVGGRFFVEGMNSLSAIDVYTGRSLWKREFPDLGTCLVYYDETYADMPLSTEYNQVHIPGANARGTNYVATEDGVYLVLQNRCLLLNAETGETLRQFALPAAADGALLEWGYVGVYEDLLLATAGFANYSGRLGYQFKPEGKRGLAWGPDRSAGLEFLAFDRKSGEIRWHLRSKHSFLHNGIVAGGGRIYLLDVLPKRVHEWNLRRGLDVSEEFRLLAVDAEKGHVLWKTDDVFGSWLSYSADRDLLLQAGSAASDRSPDEIGSGMAVYRAEDGKQVWKDSELTYAGPCILHGDTIITNSTSYRESAGAFSLLDGSPVTIPDPVTGEEIPWKFVRTYGCNTAVASEHLLTFRSGAAGFYDLSNHGGTGNFGGFKSGCSSNLIVANGVLTAPDYTRTCTCGYQNQTSLAMVPMPENELWTYSLLGQSREKPSRLQRIGVNFGAPGDRLSDNGTLWVNYPPDQGSSPAVVVELHGKAAWFRHHRLRIREGELPWVASSGVKGIEKLRVWLAPPEDRFPGFILPIADSHDDAEESPSGEMDLTSSDLEMTFDGAEQVVGVRFQNVLLQPSTEIHRVYIQFEVDESNDDPTTLEIRGHDSDHAPTFASSLHNISSRACTDAAVSWQPKPWDSNSAPGADHQSPDLTSIIKEILQRPGWKPGNAMAFIIRGTGKRVATAADGGRNGFPKLVVEADDAKQGSADAEDASDVQAKRHRVRFVFADPNVDASRGNRQFDVVVQGKSIIQQLDVAGEAGGGMRSLVTKWYETTIADYLEVDLHSHGDAPPILCGLEIVPVAP